MISSIVEKIKMLRTLAVDITSCEYYGEDDAVLGNLVPADIVNALDLLTESLRNEIAEIEKQEPVAAVPNELKHCLQVKRPSDQSVQLVFASTRTASVFELYALEKINAHKLTKP